MEPALSLIVATRGRLTELDRMLQSLVKQTWRDFDVTIVDQNPTPILDPLLQAQWPFPLRHIRTPHASGACRARNTGWRETAGSVFLFPDDDCWYPSDFLADGMQRLEVSGADVVTGRAADEMGRSINGRFEERMLEVTPNNVWTTSIEWVAFFKRRVFERIGGFDENIGIGASSPWQSCESQDIILRALADSFRCVYDPGVYGHHFELNTVEPDQAQIKKGRAYARGMGWVLRKHKVSWMRRCYWLLRPLFRAGLSVLKGRSAAAGYYNQVFLGRLEGASGHLFQPGSRPSEKSG